MEDKLIKECQKRYSVGDFVDQKTAYNGNGSIWKIKSINIEYSSGNVSIGGVGVYNNDYKIWAKIVKSKTIKQQYYFY